MRFRDVVKRWMLGTGVILLLFIVTSMNMSVHALSLSFPACLSSSVFFIFLFSFLHLILLFTPPPSSDFSISAPSPCPSPQIYHLKHLDPFTSHLPSSNCLLPTPCLSCSLSSSSSASSFSSSISSCWYSPSVWPSGEECCQYILRALAAAFVLLFFTSSFLIFFTDHHTMCHCGPRQTCSEDPGPQNGVPLSNCASIDSQCKSHSLMPDAVRIT